MKIKNLYIKEFKGLKDISINFEKNDEPLDLVVLAGSNGSGKTRILESILDYFQKIVNHIENENVAGVFFETDEHIECSWDITTAINYYVFDEENYCMRDTDSDKVFYLGDKVDVVLKKADLLTLEIAVVPLDDF